MRDPATQAELACTHAVDALLKSPTTAEHTNTRSAGSDPWTVEGWVTAENTYGARMSASYRCTVTGRDASQTVTVDALDQLE